MTADTGQIDGQTGHMLMGRKTPNGIAICLALWNYSASDDFIIPLDCNTNKCH